MTAPAERNRFLAGASDKQVTGGSDELRNRTVRRRTLHRDCFPPDIRGDHTDVQVPSFHPVSERLAHERGEDDHLARADHNHDFSYAALGEARSVATADALYTNPFENISEGPNPFVAPGIFHMRSVGWSIKEGFEDRVPLCPVEVWIRFDPAGGTAYGEWEKVAVVPPGVTQAFYEPYPWNFNPNLGTVCTTDVRVIPRVSGEVGLRLVRTGATGKIDAGFISGTVPSALPVPVAEGGTNATTAAGARANLGVTKAALVYADGTAPGGNTVANTITRTALASSFSLAAGPLTARTVVRVRARGVYGTDVLAPTLAIRLLIGTTVVLDTGTLTVTAALSNQGWSFEGDLIVKTAGGSGALECQGTARLYAGAGTEQVAPLVHTAVVSIDISGVKTLSMDVAWGTADPANTITLRTLSVEALGVA